MNLAALRRLTPLQIALGASVAVHAAVLTVRFVDPQALDRLLDDAPLEVILVNARTDDPPPLKPQAIAQASLAGGGEADAGRATSPLPPSAEMSLGEDAVDARQRIERMQQAQEELLALARREVALLAQPDPTVAANSAEAVEREQRRRQAQQLLAEIEKRIQEENARPKRRYISPSTREEVYARYYDNLRRRIEARGTRDFPQADGRKLYGELMMNVTIDAEGRLLSAVVARSSGSALLDRRAVAIVQASAPFGAFTDAMRRQTDQIVVTSRFRFTREDGLETTAVAPR